jgi:RNA recognition motif-containing protein
VRIFVVAAPAMSFRLFVGNLPMDVKKSEIEELFDK